MILRSRDGQWPCQNLNSWQIVAYNRSATQVWSCIKLCCLLYYDICFQRRRVKDIERIQDSLQLLSLGWQWSAWKFFCNMHCLDACRSTNLRPSLGVHFLSSLHHPPFLHFGPHSPGIGLLQCGGKWILVIRHWNCVHRAVGQCCQFCNSSKHIT